jgi:hypothetical protein
MPSGASSCVRREGHFSRILGALQAVTPNPEAPDAMRQIRCIDAVIEAKRFARQNLRETPPPVVSA